MGDDVLTEPMRFTIRDIQRKTDGSFVVECNSFPFHATQTDTPDVFQQILAMIDDGEPCTDYVEQQMPEDLEQIERSWRDAEIEQVKWLRERHRDEQDLGVTTTLTAEQFVDVLGYVQALRDWPQSHLFPDSAQRPQPVAWLADLLL